MKHILFKIFVFLVKIIALLPMRVLYILSDVLYPLVYYVVRYRKKVVFENLRNSFPEKSDKEITAIAKKFYRHFCDILTEILKLFNVSPEEMKRRMKFRYPEEAFREDIEKKRPILVVLGHYNNWEWGTALGMQLPYRFTSIYRPLKNELFDELMVKTRTQFGGEVVSMVKTGRWLIEAMRNEKPVLLNFLADQSPYRTEIQYWTEFLNQETPVFMGIEKIAQKTRFPVYFARFYKVRRGYYEVEVEKLCDDCSELPPYELTKRHVKALENLIREAPEYWLWTHRRWKNKKDQ